MNRHAREFLHATTDKLDEVLVTLSLEEQHDLLDQLAGEIEQRLDTVIDLDAED